jgi:CheY-like chemotaxis protein
MLTKRCPDRVQIEDHVKRISRRLMDRRKQRNASGSRDSHEVADRLIQFQQQQDRVGVPHELERLDRYQARAPQLQAEAARLLRRRAITVGRPDGKTGIEFCPVPSEVSAGIGPGYPPRHPAIYTSGAAAEGPTWRRFVVDDEDDIRTVVRKMLEAKGYTVLDAGDPQQALRLATQQPVHLLLTDVVMPLLRGTELAQRFQAVSPWTKVLLMSAYKISEITASVYPFDIIRQVLRTRLDWVSQ